MDQIEQLRAAATSLLQKAQGATVAEFASALEKATGVLKLSSELEKSDAERRKLALEERKLQYENDNAVKLGRSQRIQQYVALLTPLVTILGLAFTVFLQSRQMSSAEKDRAEQRAMEAAKALDAQWESAAKQILQSSKIPAGVIALHPFFIDPRYAERARITAIQILTSNTDPAFFDDLFSVAFVPVEWANLKYVLQLDRSLFIRLSPLSDKTWNARTYQNELKRLRKEERALYDYYTTTLSKISAQIGSVLKSPRPSGVALDLSGTFIYTTDWQGVDLSGSNLSKAQMAEVDLKNANLDGITQFTGLTLFSTVWWEARTIGPELRAYLEQNYACNPNLRYGINEDRTFTAEECAAVSAQTRRGT